jgi:dipeptidyl aminopeptidase/acylaminoacyl peptidase
MDDEHGYAHLAYFADYHSSKPSRWLTTGPWEIDAVTGIDIDSNKVYFTSTEVNSTQRHLYSVTLDGIKTKMTPPKDISDKVTVVPDLNTPIGSKVGEIGYYDASFSPNCRYFTLAYKGPDIPWKTLYSAYNAGTLS